MPAEEPLCDDRAFHLIETMRWEPGAGAVRCRLHMDRFAASASALGFALQMEEVEDALRSLEDMDDPLRVRLTLDRDGNVGLHSQRYVALPDDTVWRLGIATVRLQSGDRLIRHKTSFRHVYEMARAEFPLAVFDEVLLLNERGEICEGTITNVFIETENGALMTPPLSCGLLAGVLRAELLESGKATEQVMRLDDLYSARRVFVGNSLRGLIKARL